MVTPVTTPTPTAQAATIRAYAGPMTLLSLLFGAVTNSNNALTL